jgi:hypothetical protein
VLATDAETAITMPSVTSHSAVVTEST